jgi:hypothetical protein
MRRLSARVAVVLFLSVVTLGGWGARVLGLEAECQHMTSAHAGMAQQPDGEMPPMSVDMRIADVPGAKGASDAACCASDGQNAPSAPCTDHHGGMPCTGAQLCTAGSAIRSPAAIAADLTAHTRATPVPAPVTRVVGPVFAPEVPPPRGSSPFWS